jgi:hypothetical protein
MSEILNLKIDYGADWKFLRNYSIDLSTATLEMEIVSNSNTNSIYRLVFADTAGTQDAVIMTSLQTPSPLTYAVEFKISDNIMTTKLGVGTFYWRLFVIYSNGTKEELSKGKLRYQD